MGAKLGKAVSKIRNSRNESRHVIISKKDIFSTLDDDCLFEIFSYLDKPSLQTMKRVSKKMHAAVLYQQIFMAKVKGQTLRIEQNSLFYSFRLCRVDGNLNNMYMLSNNKYLEENKYIYRGICDSKFDDLSGRGKMNTGPIPSKFINQLDTLLQTHTFSTLTMINVTINSSFLQFLENISGDVNSIHFMRVVFEEESLGRIWSYLLQLNLRVMRIRRGVESSTFCILNENFIRSLVDGNKWSNDYVLDVMMPYFVANDCRFLASNDIIDSLLCFSFFRLPSIVLDVRWIPQLIEKRLKMQKQGYWAFCITDQLSPIDLEAFSHWTMMSTEYGYSNRIIVRDFEAGAMASIKCDWISTITLEAAFALF